MAQKRNHNGQFVKGSGAPPNGFKKGQPSWNTGTHGLMNIWNKGLIGVMPVPWNKGTNGLMKEPWNKGLSGYKQPIGTGEKISSALKGKKHKDGGKSILYKIKIVICEHCGKEFSSRNINPRFCSRSCKAIIMKPRYIKDRTKLKKSDRQGTSRANKCWSIDVKNRDGNKCKINNNDCSGRIEAHHILNWVEYPELRYDINNGIALCQFHHPKGKKKENEMAALFNQIVNN